MLQIDVISQGLPETFDDESHSPALAFPLHPPPPTLASRFGDIR
jgi:hypothetical protein